MNNNTREQCPSFYLLSLSRFSACPIKSAHKSCLRLFKHVASVKCEDNTPFKDLKSEIKLKSTKIEISIVYQLSLAQLGSAWLSLAQLGSAWLSLA